MLQQLPGVLSTKAPKETLLVNPVTGRFYSLSPSASLAWSIFAAPHTAAEAIAATLLHHIDAPPTAAAELKAFVAELQAEGLLIPAPPPAALLAYTAPVLQRGSLSQAANGVSGQNDGHTTGFGGSLLS